MPLGLLGAVAFQTGLANCSGWSTALLQRPSHVERTLDAAGVETLGAAALSLLIKRITSAMPWSGALALALAAAEGAGEPLGKCVRLAAIARSTACVDSRDARPW